MKRNTGQRMMPFKPKAIDRTQKRPVEFPIVGAAGARRRATVIGVGVANIVRTNGWKKWPCSMYSVLPQKDHFTVIDCE